MKNRQRQILFLASALISLVLLAAPARGADWFSFHVGTGGLGITFGSNDWWVYGPSWNEPHLRLSYDAVLNGYGEWVWVSGLGRVWRPWVAAGWTPYQHGRWVVTSAGWTWVSYEPWGYFPHHYGHWAYTSYGWAWVPGYTYRPANVVWVHWGGYVGWYPCPPQGWSHAARGFHHGYRDGYHDGYVDGRRDAYWATYVSWNHLSSHDVSRHATNSAMLRRTASSSEIHIVTDAPGRADVQRRGVEMAPTARLEQRTVSLGGRQVTVARPEGMTHSVQHHARSTVERALSSDVSRRVGGDGRTIDTAMTDDVRRSRSALPADRHSQRSRSARAPRVSEPTDDVSTAPRAHSGRAPNTGRAVGGNSTFEPSSTDRRYSRPTNVSSTSDVVARPRAVGDDRASSTHQGESRRVSRPEEPAGRAPATSASTSSSVSLGRRDPPTERPRSPRVRQPDGRRDVSQTRGQGTERPKRR